MALSVDDPENQTKTEELFFEVFFSQFLAFFPFVNNNSGQLWDELKDNGIVRVVRMRLQRKITSCPPSAFCTAESQGSAAKCKQPIKPKLLIARD